MAIYLISFLIIWVVGIIFKVNETQKKRRNFIIFSFFILTNIAMLRNYTVGIDLRLHYYKNFSNIIKMNWSNINNTYYEIGYTVFNKIIGVISQEPRTLIIATSLVTIPVWGWYIYKNTNYVHQATCIFILYNLYFINFNILRQAIAIAILLIAIEIGLKRKRYILYVALILLATTFHGTAILTIVLIPLSRIKFKKNYFLLVCIITVITLVGYEILINFISKFLNTQKDYTYYLYEKITGGYGIVGRLSIAISITVFILFFISFIYRRNKSENNEELLSGDLMTYAAAIVMILVVLGLKFSLSERISYYFLPFWVIGIPESLEKMEMKNRKQKIVIYFLFYMMLIGYYLFIIFSGRAELLHGTVPYNFFEGN